MHLCTAPNSVSSLGKDSLVLKTFSNISVNQFGTSELHKANHDTPTNWASGVSLFGT